MEKVKVVIDNEATDNLMACGGGDMCNEANKK